MDQLLQQLNEQQREAVLHQGSPLLILAGAGSGKTRVITVKIAYLVARLGYDPQSILAVTFTNKAAAEMRTRACELDPRCEAVMLRTFHSFGAWLLRRNGSLIGLSNNFSIYDDDDVVTLLGTLYPHHNRAMLATYARQISRAKDYGLGPDDDLRPFSEKPDLPEVYQRYQQRLDEIGNVDFGDLILKCIRLLKEHPQVAGRIQNRFRVVMVDEYQDSNVAQYQLLKELCHSQTYICVVGDDDQSIYRFRGAELKNILNFPEYFAGTHVVRLEENYRSTNPILRLAGAVVEQNQGRLGKTMFTRKGGGKIPQLFLFDDQDQEAMHLVKSISRHAWEGTAILYRTNAQSRIYETALLHAGIPYRIVGTLRFYEREEVKDALALLRLLSNGKDELAFRRIANKPARGLGPGSLDKILALLGQHAQDCMLASRAALQILSKKAAAGLAELVQFVDQFRKELDEPAAAASASSGRNLGEFLQHVLKDFGLRAYYEQEDEISGTQKLQNLDELANAASSFACSYEALREFLELIELDSARESEDEGGERVTLITMHNTKGLEFDRVYIVGLEEGLFPRPEEEGDELEEQRRLFYVALTRAREELYLSSCRLRRLYGRTMTLLPSRFLRELPEGLLELKEFGFGSFLPRSTGFGLGRKISAAASEKEGSFPRGTRVYHDDYGSGEVVKQWFSNDEDMVIVQFESGKKAQFVARYSGLESLGCE